MIKGIFHCMRKKKELHSNYSEINEIPEKYWVGTGGWHGKLKHWFSKHHETDVFMWFCFRVLHHQLPLYTDRAGTQLERSISCWAGCNQEGCRKPERSSIQEQVGEFILHGSGSLFEHTSNMHYVVVPKSPHFQNQTMIFTCYLEHWKQ